MRRSLWLGNQWAAHVTGKNTVTAMYDHLGRKGVIRPDTRQRAMAAACDPLLTAARAESARRERATSISPLFSLHSSGGAADGGGRTSRSWQTTAFSFLSRIFPGQQSTALGPLQAPQSLGVLERRGLYLHGDVGIGKTMILDLFDLCDVGLPKRRAHLHSFMTGISDRLVRQEAQLREMRRAARGNPRETEALAGVRPIDLVVRDVLSETPVLCFDEFQTFDVAHAALLSAFFTAAFQQGLFLITTSNRPPEDLCAISASFNKFLPVLQGYCNVVEVGGVRDYRVRPREEHCHRNVFLHPNNKTTAATLLNRVEAGIRAGRSLPVGDDSAAATAADAAVIAEEPPTWITEDTLWHHGRCLVIPYHCGGVAVFDFPDICGGRNQDLASADFQLLARHFHTVIVYNVPQIGTANRNAAHQFVVLVDELYQHHVKLLFTSQVPWERLLDTMADITGQAAIESPEATFEGDYYSEGEDDRSGYRAEYRFQNEEEVVSFARIRSRLTEMGCSSYLRKDHATFLVSDFDFSALVEDL